MNILVCIDFSGSTDDIVKKAEELAIAMSSKLWLTHITDPDPDFVGYDVGPQSVRDACSKKFHREHRQIQEIAGRLRMANIDITALLVQGPTVETILLEASKLNAGMIVVGSHGQSAMHQLIVGSVSEGILHKAKCPVLVVPTHCRS